jgi:uncharacterized repeat protein (TIGR03803 family)
MGNLYGTTVNGGNVSKCPNSPVGCGVVYKLKLNKGSYSYTVLYKFTPPTGQESMAGLAIDKAGNLYGTTDQGGDLRCPEGQGVGCGVVFKVDKAGDETVLHKFKGTDGANPWGGGHGAGKLVLDATGSIYGTANSGGDLNCGQTGGCGVVFKVDKAGDETVLHAFTWGRDGGMPNSGLFRDANGNLYGTTYQGGNAGDCNNPTAGCGVVFMVSAAGNYTVLHRFNGGADDGSRPQGDLMMDARGNLYGTTVTGGDYSCGSGGCGTVFKLAPGKKGNWTVTLLHSFAGAEGSYPYGGLVQDSAGNLYGTTGQGGVSSDGVLFKITP